MDLIAKLEERREGIVSELRGIAEAAESEERAELTEEERVKWTSLREALKELDERLLDLKEEEHRADVAAQAAKATQDAAERAGVRIEVGREPLTYREKGPHSFLADAYRAQFRQDAAAQERLARHSREMDEVYREYRDVGTGAFSGLVVPQYLVDLYAPFARAGRPFLDVIRNVPLPADGMNVNISKIMTGSDVAAQNGENAAINETNMGNTLLTVPVNTYAGMQDVSRQAVERGALIEEVVIEDLLSAYYSRVDAAAIAGDGTAGTHKGVLAAAGTNAVTYTDTTPTAAELWPKVADGSQQVAGGIFRGGPTHAIMHPRRFGWLMASVDSQGRPLVVPAASGPMNAIGSGEGPQLYGDTGYQIQGLRIVTDANVPVNLGAGANEDRIIIVAVRELIFWEDPNAPLQLRFEDVGSGALTVRYVVYGYSAFTAERLPKAASIISGTGLVTPTF